MRNIRECLALQGVHHRRRIDGALIELPGR
jgi:hypothetical protein